MDFPLLEKTLQLRMVYPASGSNYPVIVFSHGNGCSQANYAGLADHWASWGYVVLQPVHMDSRDLGFSMKGKSLQQMNEVVESRRADVRFVVDSLGYLTQKLPDFVGKPDADRLVSAGHSMGGGTAMVLTGVEMENPRDQSIMKSDEYRFDLLLLITEPGNNRMMPAEPWRYARVPSFVATGSKDYSMAGARAGEKSDLSWQIPENAAVQDQPRWYLNVDGADHFLGGLICKENVPGPQDYAALEMFNGASTAFLDAYLKGDAEAQSFLMQGDIASLTDDRASLENLQ